MAARFRYGLMLAAALIAAGWPCPLSAAERAASLYQRHCAACHGAGGAGDGPRSDRLDFPPHRFTDCSWMKLMSDATLFLAIKEGGAEIGMRPAMPAFGARLSDDEIAALVHLVRSFCAPPEPLAPSDPGATTPR